MPSICKAKIVIVALFISTLVGPFYTLYSGTFHPQEIKASLILSYLKTCTPILFWKEIYSF